MHLRAKTSVESEAGPSQLQSVTSVIILVMGVTDLRFAEALPAAQALVALAFKVRLYVLKHIRATRCLNLSTNQARKKLLLSA